MLHTQQIWHEYFNFLVRMKNKFSGKSKRPRCVKLIRKNIESKTYIYIYLANMHKIIQVKILEKIQNSEEIGNI